MVVTVLVLGVLGVALSVLGIVYAYGTPSASMEPALRCARPGLGCTGAHADRLAGVRYLFGGPSRGDLVSFHSPPLAAVRCGAGGVFIKRVVALPGERFSERSGRVFVNGRPLAEPYVRARLRDRRTIAPLRVPSERYFVLGDNRSSSCDSREWGTVRRRDIVAKIMVRYWPLDRLGPP